jgi:glycosyltransferase involved in cell wall biosynthesis
VSDSPPQVTICVPVYNGQAHIRETLSSISRQSYRNLNVLISDDASTDGSVEICRPFAQDPRFSLTLQPARRGWVANANWLLQTAPGDFVCITPHDDILDERYVETLVECLRADPRAAMAFCDVHEFVNLIRSCSAQSFAEVRSTG